MRVTNTCEAIIPSRLLKVLPYRLTDEIKSLGVGGILEEIHLRRGRSATIIYNGEDIMLRYISSAEELDLILERLCGGSLYAFRDSISRGYIALDGGIRVGVCGYTVCDGEKICGISSVTSLVIRIPHSSPIGVGNEIVRLLESENMTRGLLIYSPPGVGKTTVLRGAIHSLASRRRVAVIDTRRELDVGLDSAGLRVDILSGYPRQVGIEIAARTLNAEVIVCDEIGDLCEAETIERAHNCGVPLVASAHAGGLAELLNKPGILRLHKSRCFGRYVRISRRGRFSFNYEVADWEMANAVL